MNNNRWGRRLGSTIVWAVLINIAFYICMFRGVDIAWFGKYVSFMTVGLGFLVGGLTATDMIKKK